MSKIGIVGDIHFSRYSSILRSRGDKFSTRLENCIKSINWAEDLTKDCDKVIYLGDFFDSSELNSEELTAISNIKWNNKQHYLLVGNHEMGINDLSFSSSHLFNMCDKLEIIDKPDYEANFGYTLCFLPYILEDNRKPFSEYIEDMNTSKNTHRIVLSHNDIAGVQMGSFISKNGFDMSEISANCDLFINGHIHNGSKLMDNVINIGNLTGQNFSEDAFKYDHVILILDTDTLVCDVYENPHALNFYKIDVSLEDFDMQTLKPNSVITLKTTIDKQDKYKTLCETLPQILAYRIILVANSDNADTVNNNKELISINHLDKFSEFVLTNIGSSDTIKEELQEVIS